MKSLIPPKLFWGQRKAVYLTLMESTICDISDTSLWVAVYRADESERPDAVFNDPYARGLAGERGEKIVNSMLSGRKNSWSMVARTWLIDHFVKQNIDLGFTQVLNLASGLDTRPYRLDLPSDLTWIDADLPGIVEYMTTMMKDEKPNCLHKRVSIDLSKREARLAFFNEVSANGKKTLVITEGLLPYLQEEEVGALAFDLAHIPGFDRWMMDLLSPAILPMISKEVGNMLHDAKSPLIFAPEEGEAFFQLFGWKVIESRSRLKTAAQLNRLPDDLKPFASLPESQGTIRHYPWAGICVFEKIKSI